MVTPPESPAQADDVATGEPAPTVSNMRVMVRSNSTVVLALIALVVFLHWAQAVLIPITFSVFLSYALTPIVNWLKRHAKLPKAVGAAATLAIILGAVGWGLNSLQPEALDVLDIVPRATQKFSLATATRARSVELQGARLRADGHRQFHRRHGPARGGDRAGVFSACRGR